MKNQTKNMNIDERKSFVKSIHAKLETLNNNAIRINNSINNIENNRVTLGNRIKEKESSRIKLKSEKKSLVEAEKIRKKEISQKKKEKAVLKNSKKKNEKDLKIYNKELKILEEKQKNSLLGKETFSVEEKARLTKLLNQKDFLVNKLNYEANDVAKLEATIKSLDKEAVSAASRKKTIDKEKKKLKGEIIVDKASKKFLNVKITGLQETRANNEKELSATDHILRQEKNILQNKIQEEALRQAEKNAQIEKDARDKEQRRQNFIKKKAQEQALENQKEKKAKALGITHMTKAQAKSHNQDNQKLLDQLKLARNQERIVKLQEERRKNEQAELRIKAKNIEKIKEGLQRNSPQNTDPQLREMQIRLHNLNQPISGVKGAGGRGGLG